MNDNDQDYDEESGIPTAAESTFVLLTGRH